MSVKMRLLGACGLWALVAAAPIASFAQDAGPAVSDEAAIELEGIVVEARKRAEDAHDVPLSITVVPGDDVERRGFTKTRDLVETVPNVAFSAPGASRFTGFSIRGVGTVQLDSPDDTSVGVLVDGVPIPKNLADTLLFDLEQVEILRGPQGTLFGQNAQAGVINIRTRQPEDVFALALGGEWGQAADGTDTDQVFEGRFAANIPLVPGAVVTRIAGKYRDRDGAIADLTLGDDVNNLQVGGLRGTTLVTLSDVLDLTIVGDYGRDKTDHPSWVWRDAANFPAASQSRRDLTDQTTYGASVTANYQVDPSVELTSVTSWRRLDTVLRTDNLDFLLDAPVFGSSFSDWEETFDKFDQELRVTGETAGGVAYVLGGALGLTDYDGEILSNDNFGFFASSNLRDVLIEGNSQAVFGEVVVPAGKLDVTLGGRYSRDNKDYSVTFSDLLFLTTAQQVSSETWTAPTGRVALTYNWTGDFNTYALVSRGWKPGGFNRFPVNISNFPPTEDLPFDESNSWSYELGAKFRTADQNTAFSIAGFFNDIDDEQVGQFDFATFSLSILNADVVSYGFDADASTTLFDQLTLTAGLGYTRSEFSRDIVGIGVSDGQRVPGVPLWTASLGADYVHPIEGFGLNLDWVSTASWTYTGSRVATTSNDLDLDAYNLINLSTGIEWDHGKIYFFGRNLLDEEYFTSGFRNPPPLVSNGRVGVAPGPGRILGVGAEVRF